jgi:hypothetical protein
MLKQRVRAADRRAPSCIVLVVAMAPHPVSVRPPDRHWPASWHCRGCTPFIVMWSPRAQLLTGITAWARRRYLQRARGSPFPIHVSTTASCPSPRSSLSPIAAASAHATFARRRWVCRGGRRACRTHSSCCRAWTSSQLRCPPPCPPPIVRFATESPRQARPQESASAVRVHGCSSAIHY